MHYELTIALKPDLAVEMSKKVFSQIEEFVKKSGGEVERTESLGVKALSYQIGKFEQAGFERLYLQLDPSKVGELRRQLERDESLLRVFIVKVEEGKK